MLRGFAFIAAPCIALAACAGLPAPAINLSPVYLSGGKTYRLLAPSAIEKTLDMPQQISGNYNGRSFVMDAYMTADETMLTVVLYTGFGLSIAELSFDGRTAALHSPYLPQSIKPEYIVADVQFVFYRTDALAKALTEGGLSFERSFDGQEELRVIRDEGREIITIRKTAEEIRYVNHERGYRYTLRGDFL